MGQISGKSMDYSTNGATPIVCPYNKKKKKKKEKKFYPFLRTYSNLKMKTVKHFSKKL